jgi:hypothetical protein
VLHSFADNDSHVRAIAGLTSLSIKHHGVAAFCAPKLLDLIVFCDACCFKVSPDSKLNSTKNASKTYLCQRMMDLFHSISLISSPGTNPGFAANLSSSPCLRSQPFIASCAALVSVALPTQSHTESR